MTAESIPERARPLCHFKTAALICLPLAYVISFGPACWLTSRFGMGAPVLPIVYRPLLALMPFDDGIPLWVGVHGGRCYTYPSGILAKYAEFGANEVWHWRYSADYTRRAGGIERTNNFTWEWTDATP